jgi:SWI/SNF-related matrix-associated actin-dependent regulator 1 of chromatin subfamily A
MALALFPYQEAGAKFLAERPRGALFDAPGLGKTAQAIRAIDMLGLERGVVVCPASVRDVWPHEIKKFSRSPRKVLKGRTTDDLNIWLRYKADILVTSYEMATKWKKELARDFREFTVWDEGHALKNWSSQRTRAAFGHNCTGEFGYGRYGGYSWVATGTPLANDPSDVWTWLRYCGGTDLTFRQFTARYFVPLAGAFNTSYRPRKDTLAELKGKITAFSLRRTLRDVDIELPPLWITTQTIEGDTRELTALLREHPGLDKSIELAIEKGGLSFLDAAHVTTLRRLVGEAKAPVFAHQLVDEIASGLDKVVVFCAHKRPVAILQEILTAHGIGFVTLDGSTPGDHRAEVVRRFQEEPEAKVFIGNIVAAGAGLTLTAASQLVMLESDWSPANNAQALKRVHRIGQDRHVHVRFISLAKSIDEVVSDVVARKTAAIAQVQGE